MTEEAQFGQEIANARNKSSVHCQFCNTIILKPQNGKFVENIFSLPLMHQKTKTPQADLESEALGHYWQVDDMFTFENIGFSNTVENCKYLICADCDMGPIGYHNITTKCCYIALKRVKHV